MSIINNILTSGIIVMLIIFIVSYVYITFIVGKPIKKELTKKEIIIRATQKMQFYMNKKRREKDPEQIKTLVKLIEYWESVISDNKK